MKLEIGELYDIWDREERTPDIYLGDVLCYIIHGEGFTEEELQEENLKDSLANSLGDSLANSLEKIKQEYCYNFSYMGKVRKNTKITISEYKDLFTGLKEIEEYHLNYVISAWLKMFSQSIEKYKNKERLFILSLKSGCLTNKLNQDGVCIQNVDDIVNKWYTLVENIYKDPFLPLIPSFYTFRSIKGKQFSNLNKGDLINQPIPFSTTLSLHFAKEWLFGDISCICRINVPKNTKFLILDPLHDPGLEKSTYQAEIGLPAGKLIILDRRFLYEGQWRRKLLFYDCEFKPDNFIDCYNYDIPLFENF